VWFKTSSTEDTLDSFKVLETRIYLRAFLKKRKKKTRFTTQIHEQLSMMGKRTVNRISRDPLLARLGDFFALRLATLSVPLPLPAEKLWPPYFFGRRGEGDGERCQPDSEEIPRPR